MEDNTSQLWDEFWRTETSPEQDAFDLAKEERDIRWQRIERIVRERFAAAGNLESRDEPSSAHDRDAPSTPGSFADLKVIEIGAGAGTNAALMARRGAKVTVLDYSNSALARSRRFFERNGGVAEFVKADALALPAELCGRFDIAMSFGLTEHFTGEDRPAINLAHLDLLRPGGIAFIAVPNKWNPPYRLYKFISQAIGRWAVGEEHPYSRAEFRRILVKHPDIDHVFFGDSFAASFHFVNPFKAYRKLRGLPEPTDISRLRRQRGTLLDPYCSYSLVLAAWRK